MTKQEDDELFKFIMLIVGIILFGIGLAAIISYIGLDPIEGFYVTAGVAIPAAGFVMWLIGKDCKVKDKDNDTES